MPERTRAPLARCTWPRHLLGGELQDGFNRGSPGHIDQLIDGYSRLLDQTDHVQESLPVAAEERRQFPGVRLSLAAAGVIASSQGGSPFQKKVFQPDSTKNRVENRPSTSS